MRSLTTGGNRGSEQGFRGLILRLARNPIPLSSLELADHSARSALQSLAKCDHARFKRAPQIRFLNSIKSAISLNQRSHRENPSVSKGVGAE